MNRSQVFMFYILGTVLLAPALLWCFSKVLYFSQLHLNLVLPFRLPVDVLLGLSLATSLACVNNFLYIYTGGKHGFKFFEHLFDFLDAFNSSSQSAIDQSMDSDLVDDGLIGIGPLADDLGPDSHSSDSSHAEIDDF